MSETEADLRARVRAFCTEHDPAATSRAAFLSARFDAGLAAVHYPVGHGGLGLARSLQRAAEEEFTRAGAPRLDERRNVIGLGMALPTIIAFGTEEQKSRWLKPLWLADEIWCQLFSEPGAGSDLAGLATRAVRDGESGDWIVNGQKVWTSLAHHARWGLLLARTDPDVPKHAGLSYFVLDMHGPGVEVRPLRQLTGEAEFNEVFITDARVPDANRLGDIGEGWRVANATLMNERVSIGNSRSTPREEGVIGAVANTWRQHPELRTHDLHQRLLSLWAQAEVARLAGERLRQQLAAGEPGPEGSAGKLTFARLNQEISGFEIELLGTAGLTYDDWSMRREGSSDYARGAGYRYLRSKGNSIEGGTSEIMRNIIAERVLRLPQEPRTDTSLPWKDLPR
ncbi:acyl-CoA dehydrogenase [Trebonia kvetii]|uniref:Acyl-CoA dehydrogenase n=1 Tax=Trebonia kvetii TaxID=2480626 RepID=A0A6P2C1J6_9ACTN|nr:acyl-CoA dehydrogenase family protein [Trebonia kvetii]TVZ03333.1 acyl-CoA dehydrogenase [Trebonia kvetii]